MSEIWKKDFEVEGVSLETCERDPVLASTDDRARWRKLLPSLLLNPLTDVSGLKVPPAYKISQEVYDALNVYCQRLGLKIIRSKTEKKGSFIYEIGIADVQSDNDFELIEVTSHPTLNGAGVMLLVGLMERFGTSGGKR